MLNLQPITLAVPKVHLNGTHGQDLLDQQIAVMDAANVLLDALAQAAPHSRDYYTQPENVYKEARAAFEARKERVGEIYREAEELALAIQAQF